MRVLKSTVVMVVLAISGSALAAGKDASQEKLKLKLEASCKLLHRYLAPNGKVVMENLTPKTVSPVSVEVESEAGGPVPVNEIRFTAATPHGDVEVYAVPSAFDLFGKQVRLMIYQTAYLKKSMVGLVDREGKSSVSNYGDPVTPASSTLSYTMGPMVNGVASDQYAATCSIVAK